MKLKRISILLGCILGSFLNAYTQLPDGVPAPDFVLQDIEGNTHHLHQYLDEGKTVILEFGTTWCLPCWAYVDQDVLGETHKLLGPEALDQVVVLYIEAESTNTIEQLMGIQGNSGSLHADFTLGNWVEEIDYPIIDDAGFNDLFAINYFPTIYKVCPSDRNIYLLDRLLKDPLLDNILSDSCSVPIVENDVALFQYVGTDKICTNPPYYFPIEIINLGSQNNINPIIEVSDQQGVIYTQTINSVLSPFERKVIDIGPLSFSTIESSLLVEVDCSKDDRHENDYLIHDVLFAEESNQKEFIFELFTDAYGYETYWAVRDETGTIYAFGGNEAVGLENGGGTYINNPNGEGALAGQTAYTFLISLPAEGCYELILVDDYGDGICCTYGEGYFRLREAMYGTILMEGGHFSDYQIEPFSVYALSTSNQSIDQDPTISIFPNPSSDYIYIEGIDSDYQLQIFNIDGKEILHYPMMEMTESIAIHHLQNGVYFARIYNEPSVNITTTFLVQKDL